MRADTSAAIRARLIEALAERAAGLDGEARRVLDTRLAELRARNTAAPLEAPGADTTSPRPPPLRGLLDPFPSGAFPGQAAYPELLALADFRQLWATLRTDNQLRQSISHAPADAGPLNSTALASRAITLMRELSPGYLRSFLAYVDDLAWLEQMGATGTGNPSSAIAPKKRARRRSST